MGKPTGFMEYERELPKDRSPLERVKDWREFHEHFSQAKLQDQGARCMDCGIPFCHTGQLISGMASGCPINNLIPEFFMDPSAMASIKRSSPLYFLMKPKKRMIFSCPGNPRCLRASVFETMLPKLSYNGCSTCLAGKFG